MHLPVHAQLCNYMGICICVYKETYTRRYVYLYMYICMRVCIYVYVCTYPCKHACMLVCMHACMYTYIPMDISRPPGVVKLVKLAVNAAAVAVLRQEELCLTKAGLRLTKLGAGGGEPDLSGPMGAMGAGHKMHGPQSFKYRSHVEVEVYDIRSMGPQYW